MELKKRTLTGTALVAAGIAINYFSYIPYFLNAVCFLISVIGSYELLRCAKSAKPVYVAASVLWCAFTQFAPAFRFNAVCPTVLAVAFVAFAVMMFKAGSFSVCSPLKIAPFVILVPVLIRSVPEIRLYENGLLYLVFAELGCVVTDISAYFIGRRFGKIKLAPSVSPGKTVAGAAGGLVSSTVVLTATAAILSAQGAATVNYPVMIPYLFASSLVGQFGDLSFSAIKRCAGVKDYGKIFPGHGGVLDRFDSMIFTVPFLYTVLQLGGFFT